MNLTFVHFNFKSTLFYKNMPNFSLLGTMSIHKIQEFPLRMLIFGANLILYTSLENLTAGTTMMAVVVGGG